MSAETLDAAPPVFHDLPAPRPAGLSVEPRPVPVLEAATLDMADDAIQQVKDATGIDIHGDIHGMIAEIHRLAVMIRDGGWTVQERTVVQRACSYAARLAMTLRTLPAESSRAVADAHKGRLGVMRGALIAIITGRLDDSGAWADHLAEPGAAPLSAPVHLTVTVAQTPSWRARGGVEWLCRWREWFGFTAAIVTLLAAVLLTACQANTETAAASTRPAASSSDAPVGSFR